VKAIDPRAFYVGQVLRTFAGNPTESQEMNLAKHIDSQQQSITSLTGELAWRYGEGLATINTPKAQGAAGFLGQAGRIALNDIRMDIQNEYATLLAIALDDKPLRDSARILIQTMTVERPFGFRASNGKDGVIENLGSYPFGVEKIDGTLTLPCPEATAPTVIALDENGYALDTPVPITHNAEEKTITIQLPATSVYCLVQRTQQTAVNLPEPLW
jgi:hypothetical protein